MKDADLLFEECQFYIGKKLKQYLCIAKNKKDLNFIKEFEWSYNVGLCWLWWYTKWTSLQELLHSKDAKPAKDSKSEINYEWFCRVEKLISDWDGESKLDNKISQEISKFFILIKYFSSIDQSTPWYTGILDGSISEICKHDLLELSFERYNNGFKWDHNILKQSLVAAKDKEIIKEYSLGSLFNVKQVKELLQTENFVQDGRLILFELFENSVCIGLLKQEERYFYFNPQSFKEDAEFVLSSINEVAELVCRDHFYHYFYTEEAGYAAYKEEAFRNYNGSFPLGIKMFAFSDGKVAAYPPQETVLRNIGVDIQRNQYCSLNVAIQVGDLNSTKYFLDNGANSNFRNYKVGDTPIISAASYGDIELLKMLLIKGADINVQEHRYGYTPLMFAAANGHFEIVKELLARGTDYNIRGKEGESVLLKAAESKCAQITEELLKLKIDPNIKTYNNTTPLMLAAEFGHVEVIEALIKNGADLNLQNKKGMTALMLAARYGQAVALLALLERGADLNIRNVFGVKTALMLAIYYGHFDIAKKLINAGADLNVRNALTGSCAITLAINAGYIEIVKELIKAGIDLNIYVELYCKSGTLLMLAIERKQPEIARYLVKAGVNLNFKSHTNGETALMMAIDKGYEVLVKDLIEAGADVNSNNTHGLTPLSLAKVRAIVYDRSSNIINELIRAGAKEEAIMTSEVCDKGGVEMEKLLAKTESSAPIPEKCIKTSNDRMTDEEISEKITNVPLVTPKEITAFVNDYVIGQDNAKKILSVAIYNHYKRLCHQKDKKNGIELTKSNILLIGPTGSGKTLLAETLARTLNVPFAIADATTLTETGYVGDDVETVIQKLLRNCDFDAKKAENGIVYIDEIDKITGNGAGTTTRSSFDEGVQQDLLKLIEGTVANVPMHKRHKTDKDESVCVNTKNILFICGGAFPGLDKIIKVRIEKQGIGFNAEIHGEKDKKAFNELLRKVKPEDLMQYGLIPEFVGRLPIIAVLNEIDEAEMVRILREPKNALIKQYQELFSMDNIEIEFQDEVLKIIAQKALSEKIGARGLRTILENLLLDIMYNLPTEKNQGKIIIDQEFVKEF